MPRRTSEKRRTAVSTAMTTSHAASSPTPKPIAWPRSRQWSEQRVQAWRIWRLQRVGVIRHNEASRPASSIQVDAGTEGAPTPEHEHPELGFGRAVPKQAISLRKLRIDDSARGG